MREVSKVVVPGPLSGAAAGFAGYLEGLGYAPLSVVLRLRLLAHASRWLESEGLDAAGFDPIAVDRFLRDRQASHRDLASKGALEPLLTYLRSVGSIPDAAPLVAGESPVDLVLQQWAVYLDRQRGLKRSTIHYYLQSGRPFVVAVLAGGASGFDGLDAEEVSSYVSSRLTGLTSGKAKIAVTCLRSLLRFLFVAGFVAEPLDSLVPARAGYREAGLPRRLGPEQVAALIAACDQGTVTGRRDRAVIMILARLGLRAGEVARLCLDDIDWRNGTVRVDGKGGYVELVPLPADVGAALADHLAQGRPQAAADRAVFLRSRAPYRALSNAGVINVVKLAGRRAGLGEIGAHRLRHTVASQSVNAGASFEEVAQLMRHRSLASTTIYAKVDLIRLATLARPWPGSNEVITGNDAVAGGLR